MIEHKFWGESVNSFPYEELANLQDCGCSIEFLVPHLDIFFSTIDGYAGSARTLEAIDRQKLLNAQSNLSRSFFEMFPQYGPCRDLLTGADMPRLHRRFVVTEELRLELRQLVDELVGRV